MIRRKGRNWEVIVYAGRDPDTGRELRISRTVPGTDRQTRPPKAARDLEAQLRLEAATGAHTEADHTVAELLDAWYELGEARWAAKTAYDYRRVIARHLKPTIGSTKLSKLRTARIDCLYATLAERGGTDGKPLSAASVRLTHAVLHRALEQGIRWGWLNRNPASHATKPTGAPREINPPEPADLTRLLAVALDEDPDLGALLHLAAITGARRGELCALRWPDLDLDTGTIRIERSIDATTLAEKPTKTNRARAIALDEATVALLRQHRVRCLEWALECGGRLAADGYIFTTTPDGSTPVRPEGVSHRFMRLRDQLGLDRLRLHDLRHYAASQALAAGIDIPTVAGRLGHAQTSTTLDVYAHRIAARDRDAAEALARTIARS